MKLPLLVASGHALPPKHCPQPAEEPSPKLPWPEALRTALMEVLQQNGPQRRPFVIQSACSGTGAPSIAMEAKPQLCFSPHVSQCRVVGSLHRAGRIHVLSCPEVESARCPFHSAPILDYPEPHESLIVNLYFLPEKKPKQKQKKKTMSLTRSLMTTEIMAFRPGILGNVEHGQ